MSHLPFSEIEGCWIDPVFIIGGGTSLLDFDFSCLKDRGTIVGVNRSAWVHDCDALVTLDQHFARMCRAQIQAFVYGGGEAILAMPPGETGHKPIDCATYVYRRRNKGLSTDKRDIYGINSGYAALGVSFLKGAKDIRLLGFDMQYGADGRTHHHGGYSWHRKGQNKFLNLWSNDFVEAKKVLDEHGVRVINYVGEPESLISCFEKRHLSELYQKEDIKIIYSKEISEILRLLELRFHFQEHS